LYCRQATLILDAAYKDEAGNAEGGPAASAEKPKYAVGVSVLLTRGSQLLLGKRKNVSAAGLYSTPGGRIEPDENMAQCAIREFNEETGAVLGGFMFIDFREHMRFGHHYFMFYAHADSYEGEITNTQPDKCEGWEWFDLARLPENCTEPPEVIEKLNRLMPAASAEPRTPEADEVQKRKEAGIQSYDGGQLGASLLKSAEPRTPAATKCWPWAHEWTKWQMLDRGELYRLFAPTSPIVGRYETQRRECMKCGKAQMREI